MDRQPVDVDVKQGIQPYLTFRDVLKMIVGAAMKGR